MNCLGPTRVTSPTCRCQCTCGSVSERTRGEDRRQRRRGYFSSFVRNLFGFDRNRNNTYYSYTNKGGALLAKYSYKKLSQNEAEFIPDDCSEYKTPIIKAARVRGLAGGNTDDCDTGEGAPERLRLLDEDPGDTGTESGMSISEGGACSKGLQYCSDGAETMTESGMSCSTEDTGTQYCSGDAGDQELGMAEYDFSVHFPVSLREEDCDWDDEDVTCNVCDRSFPTPVHLDAHMVKYRHWLCNTCDKLFNSVMQLEYHKDSAGHWSDEYEIDSASEDEDNIFSDQDITHAIIEQETAFGPNGDKNILMCHQF